ncbi:glycosyl hydrolase family 32 [Streptomyces pseudovenezuelae]|uniref:beta-fructofuranosidase n=1 Tax=Streptomyces pseudovenezuelae TaxID=67350 RepID=A0ABT6M1X8_9ACTN|nr:glycosyl hydrolase family 32 [Streptomyces pseudovenezuelae]MDH6222562.1 beta-fructofuranosidase [Streptomyces pseudovenezuelae]
MTFHLDHAWVWDFWFADDGDTFHMYYLHAPKSLGDPELRHRNARIGHATSTNLTDWQDHGPVLGPGAAGGFDETAVWTGSVLRGPDGLWRMFYTGARFADPGHNTQAIGVATSTDLHTWTKQLGPITEADDRWYEKLGTSSWPEEAWRDPWVFPDPDGQGWHMLVTARANHGAVDDRGVIAHATSPDLRAWTVQPPLSSVGAGFSHLEVPQLATIQGEGTLLISCDTQRLSAARRQAGQSGGIWSIPAPFALGPYPTEDARLVVAESLYSGRVIQDRTGRTVMLAFDNTDVAGAFLGAVCDPFPVGRSPAHPGIVPLSPSEGTPR